MTVKCPNSFSPWWLFASLYLFTLFCFVMEDIHIASLNVNWARDSRTRAQLCEMMRQKREDILFIQETHSVYKIIVDWTMGWPFLPEPPHFH